MSDMTEWYVEIVIHGKVPAKDHLEALSLMSDYVRDGIGTEPVDGERKWGTALAAAYMWDPTTPGASYVAINEEYAARHRGGT